MEQLFLDLYRYFQKRRATFWSVFGGVLLLLMFTASRISVEEDITRFFPDDERVEKLDYVFRHSKFAERLVFMVSVKDSTMAPQPDSLIAFTETLVARIDSTLKPYITTINSRIDDDKVMSLMNTVQDNLPLFLEERDYAAFDSLTKPDAVRETLTRHYRQLISPAGMVTKRIIVRDPLGFSFLALKKLQQLQYDNNVEVYDNYLVSKDHRHLIFFIQPAFRPTDTGKNAPFLEGLDKIIAEASVAYPSLKASYFGATSVAAGNARQLQRDTIITISLMLLLLAVFLFGFFRRKRVPFLILIPVAFGALFSLSCIFLIQGSISVIAIAAGSIILGIAVNYSLHFLSHLKHTGDVQEVIKDLVRPMTLGSTTTVLAFLCLQFVNASVLRDLGLFAAFSLIGAALCSLIFLPQLISPSLWQDHRKSWIEKVSLVGFDSSKYTVATILLLTPVFFYFAQQVSFSADLGQLNFMKPEVREAQQRLEAINRVSLSSVYVVSQDKTLEKALRKNELTTSRLDQLKNNGSVQRYSSVSSFVLSDSLQRVRLNRWNAYWTKEKVDALMATVRQEGKQLKFSDQVFLNFKNLLTRPYVSGDSAVQNVFRRTFFDDYIIEKDGLATVITLANVQPEQKDQVYRDLDSTPSNTFDRQMLANLFVEYVHADFNFIVTFTSVLVFIALLISYGRIELTLITFIPMLITWIWILGIMALAGIEFNIVNVMISTFIFGLGDDYSIFIMDGLQQEYKLGRKNLASIRTSILLSALTTISGLGVLIFAEHPALRSIAGISIIGIVCVFVVSQTIEPFLFRWLITRRAARGLPPMTFFGICKTIFTYGFFVFGSLFLTVIGLILKIIPFGRKKVTLFYHTLLSAFTRSLIALAPGLKVTVLGQTKDTFSKPSVIISNHTSFLDILLTTMLHPRLILVTNKWVWNSPVFGGVVRLAGYYPVTEGAEDSTDHLRARVNEGYSVVVFPEGTRSTDGRIKRFHKGAFYMAETLNLPVQPLLIHGAADTIPKSTMYLNNGAVVLKFLPAISPADTSFGKTYSERTKAIGRYFKEEFARLQQQQETPPYYQHKLIANYLYKGPVLEWYMRIKLRLESYYEPFHKLVPLNATVLDLGCGYGFLSYMLYFLSDGRQVTGVDYDEEKIGTASQCYARNARVNFICADATRFDLQQYDTIIIADVLHYMEPAQQREVIRKSIDALLPGGRLIIREGNADLKDRHQGTQLTEFFSVKLLKFNKSVNDLHFISGETVKALAFDRECTLEVIDDTKFTSNVIFVIGKKA